MGGKMFWAVFIDGSVFSIPLPPIPIQYSFLLEYRQISWVLLFEYADNIITPFVQMRKQTGRRQTPRTYIIIL